MTVLKSNAFEIVYHLYNEDIISSADYTAISEALNEIESLRERDMILEELWQQFEDIPMDPKTECIEDEFLNFPVGTPRTRVWHWFDRRHSKGIGYLLYGDGIDRTDLLAKMVYLKQLCPECESCTCQFNHHGECRFAMVHEREPRITDAEGCIRG